MTAGAFAVPVRDRWLIHAPLHGVSALVNRAAVASLSDGEYSPGLDALRASFAVAPQKEPVPPEGPASPEFVGLIPTRTCNLACRYCAFGASAAAPETMDLALAAAAVDWMAGRAVDMGRSLLEVHFFGGEPTCAADVVDAAVHRARARAVEAGLTPRFEIATNGVFDERRCRFLGDYFDSVVLSFDGPQEVHDRHRPGKSGAGSFAAVARNARLLGETPAELCIRTCVTRDTVGDLDRITEWFCGDFRPSTIAFESLQATPESEEAGLMPPDPWEFARKCVRASRAAASRGVTPVYAAASVDVLRHSFCPVGRDSLILSPDGRVSACYLPENEWTRRGLDLNLGRMDGAGGVKLDPEALGRVRDLTAVRGRCTNCLARWHCAGACHVNHSYPGCPEGYDDFCIQTRIIVASRLLDGLGHPEETDRLLEDRAASERLALRGSDLLADWGRDE